MIKQRNVLIFLLTLSPLLIAIPTTATEDGASTIVYTPFATDAKAFFFRIQMNEATDCVIYRYRADMSPGEPLPWIASDGTNNKILSTAGQRVLVPYRSWGLLGSHNPQDGTGHVMLNVSAGSVPVHRHYAQTGYNEREEVYGFRVEDGLCDLKCRGLLPFTEESVVCRQFPTQQTVAFDLFIVMTPRVRNVSVTFDFYNDTWFNTTTLRNEGIHGDARGSIAFASESNETFLKQLKDFDGTASYNGDPVGIGFPSAGGVNLETIIHAERGMVGIFGDPLSLIAERATVDLLSYVGPHGNIGVISDGPHPLTPPRFMESFQGDAGEWTFRAHAYENPTDHASLFLVGADIETG